MKLEELPLLDIFNSLRQRHGLPLGVEEYLAVVRSLEAGFGIANREELEQLCCMLWAKSEQENRLIRRLFGEMWIQIESLPENSNSSAQENPPTSLSETESDASNLISDSPTPENHESSPIETSTPEEPQVDEPLPDLDIPPTITPEPVQAVQAVRSNRSDREIKRPRYALLTEYFPVTKRQMKQCWRSLRRPIRQGIPTELDVEETVAKIGREGILLQPVLMPPRTNRSDLVILIDQEGSMVPFHELSRQLVETARRGGRLRTTNVYYFHDYPNEYLYQHPAMVDAKTVSEILDEIDERTAVLIVSDAGAARGNFDQERIDNTKLWIEQLQQSVRYFAWLNPMPSECWRKTTAEEIAGFVPMFEMSSQGMNSAISALRGRYVDRYENLPQTVRANENANDDIKSSENQTELQQPSHLLEAVPTKQPNVIESLQAIDLEKYHQLIFQILFGELKSSTKASEANCQEMATRIADEVLRICNQSKLIQASGDIKASAIALARHRLSQCLRYYQMGTNRGRIELHSTLSAIISRYINPPNRQLSYQDELSVIEDFLINFYLEALNACRRENRLPPTYLPQTLLELAEYMAFTERYAKRRIPLPGRQQQLIILRAQTFSQQQPPEAYPDIEKATESRNNDGNPSWKETAVQQLEIAMALQSDRNWITQKLSR